MSGSPLWEYKLASNRRRVCAVHKADALVEGVVRPSPYRFCFYSFLASVLSVLFLFSFCGFAPVTSSN